MRPVNLVTHLPGRRRGFFYGWRMVAVSSLVSIMGSVPLSHALSVWAVALERHFGWSRTQLGFALTFARVEESFMGPAEGYLTDRFGTRRMVLSGLLVVGVGFLFFSQIRSLWMFYLAYAIMALGHGFAGWVPLMTLLNHWFSRSRSIAVGWSSAGGRLGALVLVPAIAWAVNPDRDRLGWELTAMIIGVFVLVMAFPITRLIRNRPQEYGLLPDGAPVPPGRAAAPVPSPAAGRLEAEGTEPDLTVAEALRTPAFWLISFGHGFSTAPLSAIWVHLGLLLEDAGFNVQTTAWVIAVYTAVTMAFQLIGGYLGDRLPKRVCICLFTLVQASAVVLLTSPDSPAMIYLFAVLLGVGWGGRNPLLVAIRGEYFGRSSFGKILGISTVPINAFMLASAPLAGYVRDTRGSYAMAFLVLGALNFVGGVLFLLARKPSPRRAPGRAAGL